MQSSRWATPAAAALPPPADQPAKQPEQPEQPEQPAQPTHPIAESTPYPPHPSSPLDEFAQTRGADDLFDDDYTPITAPMVVEQVHAPQYIPPPQSEQQHQQQHHNSAPPPPPPSAPANRAEGRAQRGRGGRGARGGNANGSASGNAAVSAGGSIHAPPAAAAAPVAGAGTGTGTGTDGAAEEAGDVAGSAGGVVVPTGPKGEKKDGRAKGDRSGTGGVKPERLTEAQLSEKLASMALKNAALTAAHERSLQDEAAFALRESKAREVAAVRRKEERQNRQVMMGERERNRQRKLQALGGREWDAEKKEEDLVGEREPGRARRGAHGAIAGAPTRRDPAASAGAEDDYNQGEGDAAEGPSRGGFDSPRGGRGGRGGRGRGGRGGRGGRDGETPRSQQQQQQHRPPPQAVPKPTDFPDLPYSAAPKATKDVQPAPKIELPHKKKENPPPSTDAKDPSRGEQNGNKGAVAAVKDKVDAVKEVVKEKFTLSLASPGAEKKSWADQVEGS